MVIWPTHGLRLYTHGIELLHPMLTAMVCSMATPNVHTAVQPHVYTLGGSSAVLDLAAHTQTCSTHVCRHVQTRVQTCSDTCADMCAA